VPQAPAVFGGVAAGGDSLVRRMRSLWSLAVAGAALFLLAESGGWSARGSPRPLTVAPEEASAPPEAEPSPVAAPSQQRAGKRDAGRPGPLFDGDEVTRLQEFLLDPANCAEVHVEARGRGIEASLTVRLLSS